MELKLHGKYDHRHAGDHQVLDVEAVGRLSRNGMAVGGDPLRDMFGDEIYAQGLLLSLEKCEYLDSSGVEWLLQCHNRFSRGGGKIVIHSAKPKVAQLLRIMRMQKVLRIAEDVEQARIVMTAEHPADDQHGGSGT